jgi:hypothetical protein
MYPIVIALLFLAVQIPFSLSQYSQFNLPKFCLELGLDECLPDFPATPDTLLIPEPGDIRPDQKPNHWKVEDLQVSKPEGPTTNITASFVLSRSIWTPCGNDELIRMSGPIASQICWWQISQDPILCYSASHKAGEWQTCEQYVKRVEGERMVSSETRNRLRWRFIDQEDHSITDKIPGATPSTVVPLVWLDTKITHLQIVYGVPLNE